MYSLHTFFPTFLYTTHLRYIYSFFHRFLFRLTRLSNNHQAKLTLSQRTTLILLLDCNNYTIAVRLFFLTIHMFCFYIYKASFAELTLDVLANTFFFPLTSVQLHQNDSLVLHVEEMRRLPWSTLRNRRFFSGTVKVTITRRNQLVQFWGKRSGRPTTTGAPIIRTNNTSAAVLGDTRYIPNATLLP